MKRNLKLLFRFLLTLMAIVITYSVLFHFIMIFEDREFTWITGFYWTLTVMSTLGFGDITFASDLGKIFTLVVLMSGIVFLLVMLPFTFIQFFYAPWLEAQSRARAPRELPENTTGHVILTNFDPITINLVEKLKQYNYEYAIISPFIAGDYDPISKLSAGQTWIEIFPDYIRRELTWLCHMLPWVLTP